MADPTTPLPGSDVLLPGGPEVTPELVPEISHLMGPHMLGFVLCAALFGVAFMAFSHWVTFGWFGETKRIRALATGSMTSAAVTMAFILAFALRLFCFRFGRGATVEDGIWQSVHYGLDTICRLPVAAFFACRTYRLWDCNKLLIPLLLIAVVVPAIGSLAGCVTAQMMATGQSRAHLVVEKAWLISEIASNYLLTVMVAWRMVRTGTLWRAGDTWTTKARLLMIESMGGPTLLSTAAIFVMTLAPYSSYIYVFTGMPISYTVALMLLLASQFRVSAHRWTSSAPAYETFSVNGHVKSRVRAPTNINVTTEVYQHTERDTMAVAPETIQLRKMGKPRVREHDHELGFEDVLGFDGLRSGPGAGAGLGSGSGSGPARAQGLEVIAERGPYRAT